MARFCSECGSLADGMKFCAEYGTPLVDLPTAEQPVETLLSHDEQVAILEKEMAALANEGWEIEGRVGPYEVCLKRRSGLTARQFLPLWVQVDGSLWTNAAGIVEGGRLRDNLTVFRTPGPLSPTLWKPAPSSDVDEEQPRGPNAGC